MLDYSALRVLQAVIQTGSFERAASQLNVTPSAVSQRIKQLEERLGTALVARGNPCAATEKGAWLCRHMENVGVLEAELLKTLPSIAQREDLQPKPTLQIATNADSLGTWFIEAAAEFFKTSGYFLNVCVDDQDHTAEWLKQGKVVAAVTSAEKPISGCRRFSLGALRYHATASPEFVKQYFGQGVTPDAIAVAPSLTFNQKDRLQAMWVQRMLGKAIHVPTHWLPSTQSFVDASLMGMGWGMNPAFLVERHLASGRLVELVKDSPLDVNLYWQINRLSADRLSSLTRAVIEVAKRSLI